MLELQNQNRNRRMARARCKAGPVWPRLAASVVHASCAAGLERSAQAGSTSAVTHCWLGEPRAQGRLAWALWAGPAAAAGADRSLSTGALHAPQVAVATFLTVSQPGEAPGTGWTAQVWCHKDPASGQMLPGQAVRPQGSGFSDQPLAPGRGEHLGPVTSQGTAFWGPVSDVRTAEALPVPCSGGT